MRTLILFTAVSLNLSCAQPQKFEANVAVTNTNNNQSNSEAPVIPTDALIFTISEDGKVFCRKKTKKNCSERFPKRTNFGNHSPFYLKKGKIKMCL